jgi:hypothetical protein
MRSRGQVMSQHQEASVAKDLGGRVQVASGATEFAKGDIRVTGKLRVECKTTSTKSYAVKLAEIQKIQGEALTGGMEDWAMQIEFQGQLGQHKKVAIIGWESYLDLLQKSRMLDSVRGTR